MKTFRFGKGSHATREQGMCVNEAAAYLAGEPHSDHPACMCPVIGKLSIWVNDAADDDLRHELLLDLPWRLVGTKSTPEVEARRGYMAADWAVRVVAPILLRRAGLVTEAASLESLPEVTDRAAADAAYAAARAARAAADAAADSAADAAVDAAADAADAAADAAHAALVAAYAARAADAAAYAAARAAARAAAHAAADAARAADAAADAARAADLDQIIRSCVVLIDRMIRLTEPQERVVTRERQRELLGI